MDDTDRKICEVIQERGRVSSAALAELLGLPVSTAHDRLRRLEASGVILAWRAALDPMRIGAGLCAFMLIDMGYEGEAEAVAALRARPELMELHHVSGRHSYLAKIRVADMAAAQAFLDAVVKPLRAVQRTETIFAMETLKETSAAQIAPAADAGRRAE